jgi:hypothetical protein
VVDAQRVNLGCYSRGAYGRRFDPANTR